MLKLVQMKTEKTGFAFLMVSVADQLTKQDFPPLYNFTLSYVSFRNFCLNKIRVNTQEQMKYIGLQ